MFIYIFVELNITEYYININIKRKPIPINVGMTHPFLT